MIPEAIGLAALILAGASAGDTRPPDSTLVARMQNFSVGQIDSTLGTGTFASWLERALGPNATITWEVNDCGEGGDGRPAPTCVGAEARLQPRGRVYVMMMVGNGSGEMVGDPALWSAEIQLLGPLEEVKRLADLPATVRRLRAVQERLSRLPDRALDDSTTIQLVQRMSVRRLSDRLPDVALADWIAGLTYPAYQVTWHHQGCQRSRAIVDMERPGLVQDYWSDVVAMFGDARASVGIQIRVGTCAKGPLDPAQVVRVWVRDARPGRASMRDVKLDDLPGVLEAMRR